MANKPERVVLIGVAGDSGCGKSTFLRRLTDLFGAEFMTVICLDDYHCLDRKQRKEVGVTALNPKANNFDLMYEQIKALKEGQAINKPIYNHETGMIDPPEIIEPNKVIVIEGLHPLYDERVRALLDFSVYLDISDEVKVNWKIQRDMAERGHTYDDVMAAINSRKPDFSAYIDPQRQYADVVIQVLPTQLLEDHESKLLRVRLIQKEGVENFEPAYLFDEGSTIDWRPCGRKLTCAYPTKYYGEMTELLLKHKDYPGSTNGTGLFQVLVGLKMRETYEKLMAAESKVAAQV